METIEKLKYDDMFNLFGDPNTEKGIEKIKSHLIRVPFPFAMNNGKVKTLYCNRYIAQAVIDALKEIEEKVGLAFLQKIGLDEYNGAYNHRQTRDKKWWSIHTWGGAIDLCGKLGRMGKPPMLPYWYVNAFVKRGFYWGGNWKGKYTDGMHFSCVNG